MKCKHVLICTCVTSLSLAGMMTPVLARGVTQAQRTACERAALDVRPALRADEKEAWIANCLANATAGSPPMKSRDY
jgi:hypothetical protein